MPVMLIWRPPWTKHQKSSCALAPGRPDKAAVERFTRELIPLVLNGPPTATGYGEGRPAVREVVAYWPALLHRELGHTRVLR